MKLNLEKLEKDDIITFLIHYKDKNVISNGEVKYKELYFDKLNGLSAYILVRDISTNRVFLVHDAQCNGGLPCTDCLDEDSSE